MLRYLRFLLLASATLQRTPEATQAESNPGCSLPPDFKQEESTNLLLTRLCTGDNLPAQNKPPVRIGVGDQDPYKGKVVPLSCMFNENKCQQEAQVWNDWAHQDRSPVQKKYSEMKKAIEDRMTIWRNKIDEQKKQAMKKTKITSAQLQEFDTIYGKQLHYLKIVNVTSQVLMEYKLGNCGEQLAYSAIRLYEQAQKCNLNIRIQIINLTKKGAQHAFLLIDSDAKDTVLNDAAKIAKYLKKLKKSQTPGTICDLYNEGLLVKFKDDRSNLYDENGQWTQMRVETLGIDLEKTQSWPGPLKGIIDNALVELELGEAPAQTKTCSP